MISTRTLYVSSIYWRNCDTLLSVAGWSKSAVDRKASELAIAELADAVDAAAYDAVEPFDESGVRAELESDLIVTRAHAFDYPCDSLGIPAENLAELETEGITVY